jgi:hypothetical protein
MTFNTASIVVCARCYSQGELARLAVGAGWHLFAEWDDAGPDPHEFELCPSCAEAFRRFMAETPHSPALDGVAS